MRDAPRCFRRRRKRRTSRGRVVRSAEAGSLLRLFARNGTWQVPTLTTLEGLWNRNDLQDADRRAGERMKARQLEVILAMHRAGVGLLAGTDAPPDRANLPDELAMFVKAGLTPREALRVATINPARFLNREGSLGTIAPGKLADLVLLDADPLQDIANTKQVFAVVANGTYYLRSSLEAVLAAGEPKR